MGRKSTKENKSEYQIARESAGLTREAAGEKMIFVTSDKIEKIENGRSSLHPEDVMAMAECYEAPELKNYFCTHECPIGQKHVQEVKPKELSQIVLDLLASINRLSKEKERLVEITVDGEITEEEYEDFDRIISELKIMKLSADTLQLWLEKKKLRLD